MKNINLDYGNSKISFSLPNSCVVVEYGKTYEDPPIVDPITTTKEALKNPLNFSPLKKLEIRVVNMYIVLIRLIAAEA